MKARWLTAVWLVILVGPSLAAAQTTCNETFTTAFANAQLAAIAAIAQVPSLDGLLPNPADGVTLFAPTDAGVESLLNSEGLGAAAIADLTTTLAAVILQNILPAPYTPQELVASSGGVNSILGLYLGRSLPDVASTSPTNSSQVLVRGPVGAAVPIVATYQVCASYMHVIDGLLLPSENISSIPTVNPANVSYPELLSIPPTGAASPPPIIFPPNELPTPPPSAATPAAATPAASPTASAGSTPAVSPAAGTTAAAPSTTVSSPAEAAAAAPAPAPSGAAAVSVQWCAMVVTCIAVMLLAS